MVHLKGLCQAYIKGHKEGIITILAAAMCIFSVVIALLKLSSYNGDNFFMFSHAKLILEEGFTDTEPLTMHEGLAFMYPQWLFAVAVWLLKTYLGDRAVVLTMLFLAFLTWMMLRRCAKLISDGSAAAWLFALAAFTAYSVDFVNIRPQMVTILGLLCQAYCIEKHIRGEPKWLLWHIPISVLLINLHNSLWVSMYLVYLCYAGEWCLDRIRGKNPRYGILPLIIVMAGAGAAALANPYGPGYITYIFKSMQSIRPFRNYIMELMPVTSGDNLCITALIVADIATIETAIVKKGKIPAAYLLMWGGFLIMGIMHVRNFIFFCTLGQFPVFSCLVGLFPRAAGGNQARGIKRTAAAAWLAASAAALCLSGCGRPDFDAYRVLDWAIENESGEGTTMFTSFNTGSYAEYLGYRVYIDARAEVFGIANNGIKDIASEYMSVVDMDEDDPAIHEFVESYKFDYILSEREDFEKIAEGNENYELICRYGEAKLYKRKENG